MRRIALALPEVTEQVTHGAIGFFVRKRPVCYYHDNHRGDGRVSIWCPAPPGAQDELVNAEPRRFFRPPTSASGAFSSWLGMYLDEVGEAAVDWTEAAAMIN